MKQLKFSMRYVITPMIKIYRFTILQLVAATTMAFARAIGDFGVTLMIAGNIPGKTQTAALAIYDDVSAGRMDQAGILVLVVCIISGLVLYV